MSSREELLDEPDERLEVDPAGDLDHGRSTATGASSTPSNTATTSPTRSFRIPTWPRWARTAAVGVTVRAG